MSRIENGLGRVLRGVSVALLVGILVLMVASVVNRFFPFGSLDWSDEILELMLVWMIFTGTAEVWRVNQHFAVEIGPLMVQGTRFERTYRAFIILACLVFIGIFTWKSLDLFLRADDLSPYFSWSRRLWYGAMPLNGLLMMLFSLRQLRAILPGKARKSADQPSTIVG
jgi:TRAP-type C4-dicarboxylate transport system permease small subunit